MKRREHIRRQKKCACPPGVVAAPPKGEPPSTLEFLGGWEKDLRCWNRFGPEIVESYAEKYRGKRWMQTTAQPMQENDEARFNDLMRRTYRKVYNMAYRLSGNRADAEDLTQEAYFRAYRSFDSYEESKPFENWIFRIVTRLFLDLLRYRRRRVQTVSYDVPLQADGTDDQVYLDTADERDNPEETLLRSALSEAMERALLSLSPRQRLLVVLADIEGIAYQDIAEMLDTPVGTIRSRLHRIHKTLRSRLEKYDAERAVIAGEVLPTSA